MAQLSSNNRLGFSTGRIPQLWAAITGRGGPFRLLRNMILDLRYGGKLLGGAIANPNQEKGQFHTMNTGYRVLEHTFSHIELTPEDIIVDIGCGKGRIFNFLLSKGWKNRAIGVEINPEVARFTAERLSNYKQIEILEVDVLAMKEIPGTIFYLFNPFDGKILGEFVDKLEKQSHLYPAKRPLILYNNCMYREVIENRKNWRVLHRFTRDEVESTHGGMIFQFDPKN